MTPPADPRRWFAIHAKPKQEDRADANLRRWGLETLLPLVLAPERERGRGGAPATLDGRWRPLFPGYLFARFDAHELLHKVRLTRGVHSVVGFGEMATPVDDAVIAFLRSGLDAHGCVQPEALRAGDAVEIIDGPMRSMIGIFQSDLSEQDRVLILLTTVSAQARVNIQRGSIKRCVPPRSTAGC